MAEEIVAKYRVDVTEASKNLTDLANTAKRAEDALKKYEKAASDAFDKGAAGARALNVEVSKQPKAVEATQLELKELKDLLRDIAKVGTSGFKDVTAAIKDAQKEAGKTNVKLEETKQQGTGLIGTFKSLAVTLGVAFGVQQIIAFGKEAVNLAAKAEGVERAFQRIGSTSILEELRAATRGTVTDLVLMQNAVKASNFKIPLEQLGSLFAFAQARARETGESVDYLVDSIILGIGRKSPLILDNLGISAVELRTRLKGVGVEAANIGDIAQIIGDIATEEMQKMGNQADTTADKIAQLSTAWTNFQTSVGSGIVGFASYVANTFGLIQEDANAVSQAIAQVSTKSITEIRRQVEAQKELVEQARNDFSEASSNRLVKQGYNEIYDAAKRNLSIQSDILEEMERLQVAREAEIKGLNDLDAVTAKQLDLEKARFEAANANKQEEIKNVYYYTEAIKALNEQINAQGTAEADIMPLIKERAILQAELTKLTTEQATGTALLNQQLSELKKELDSAEIGGAGFWAVLDKIEKKTKELWEASAMTKLADALIPDVEGEDANLTAKIAQENALDQEAYLAKMKNREDFDKWLKEQDEKRLQEIMDNDRAQVDSDRQMYEDMASAVQTYGAIAQQINSLISEAARIETEKELIALEAALEAGQITREQYDQERRRLLSKQAADEKAANIFAAIISTAAAVADALPNIPLSIIAAALGAAQIAVIASQPIPKFAKGGYVDEKGMFVGKSHKQGGITIEAEGGEFITSKAKAQKYGHIVEAVNKGTIDKLIKDSYVTPAVNAALLNGFSDIGTSAQLNGLTAKLSDHNIIAAMDRNRQATTYGLAMIANEMRTGKRKNRRGYA